MNYILELPRERNKGMIYHCNLMKPYFIREQVVNVVVNVAEVVAAELPALVSEMSSEHSADDIMTVSVNKLALDESQVGDLHKVFEEFHECFSSRPGRTTFITHETNMASDKPIQSKQFCVPPHQ